LNMSLSFLISIAVVFIVVITISLVIYRM